MGRQGWSAGAPRSVRIELPLYANSDVGNALEDLLEEDGVADHDNVVDNMHDQIGQTHAGQMQLHYVVWANNA